MSAANSSGGRKRVSKNQHTTKSGNTFKIHRNLTEKWVARRDAAERRKAERMAGLPKSRLKRFLYHFHPKRMYHYWFSRDGGIMALKIVGIGLVVCFLLLVGVFAYFRKDLPKLNDVYGSDIGGSIRYYDRSGRTLLWEDYDAVKRIPVKTDQISPYVRDATVAIEDKDFFKHGGFDVRGIVRAGLNDVLHQGTTQGGSTITQQLVKLSESWTDNRTFSRKIKEVILAVELEREYSKQDILTGYLNTAPYGNIEYGVEAAARDYFQKSAKSLTLEESAFLAAIPKSPAVYSPYGPYFDEDALVGRQHYIIDQMADQGYVTRDQAKTAKEVKILKKIHKQQTKFAGIKAPWFVLAAKAQLEQEYGQNVVNRGGWKVITTLDMKLQKKAEQLVRDNLPNITRYGADTEATVAEDVTNGQIVALVGGTDFQNKDHGQNNFAAGIKLPPGSSIKPYDYATFIENHKNVGASSVLYDVTGPLPGYPCTNRGSQRNGGNCLNDYDFRQPGPITLRYALGGSRNIPAVKAMLSSLPNDTSPGRVNSINKVINTATDMMYPREAGTKTYNCYADEALTKTTQCYAASGIGDGAYLKLDDHVNGYATLARMGKAIPRTYILSITDSANKNVKLRSYAAKQAIRPDTAYIINDIASDPRASYFPGNCTETNCVGGKFHRFNGWKFAIKTGTTNDAYDGLMGAWSPKYSVMSWVGHHTRHVALNTSMETLTMPLTRGLMEYAHTGLAPVKWQKPSGVKTGPGFFMTRHIHYGEQMPGPSTDLYPSWYTGNTNKGTNKPVDIVSNKLATSCTPSLATKVGGNSNSNNFNVDIFVGGGSSGAPVNTNANDDIHKCGDERPSINSLTFNGQAGANNCDSPCSIKVSVSGGTHPLVDPRYSSISGSGTVNLMIDGRSVQSKAATGSVTFSYSGSGNHSVKVQVIDSVLYDSTSDNLTVDFGGGSGSVNLTSASRAGPNVKVHWQGGEGPFDFTDNLVAGTHSCNSSPCNLPLASFPVGSTITITDDEGNSDSATVTN